MCLKPALTYQNSKVRYALLKILSFTSIFLVAFAVYAIIMPFFVYFFGTKMFSLIFYPLHGLLAGYASYFGLKILLFKEIRRGLIRKYVMGLLANFIMIPMSVLVGAESAFFFYAIYAFGVPTVITYPFRTLLSL